MIEDDGKNEKIARAWRRVQAAAEGRDLMTPETASAKDRKIDGRRARATGRNQQLNVKLSATAKTEFLALAQAHGVTQGELLELMLRAWKSANGASA